MNNIKFGRKAINTYFMVVNEYNTFQEYGQL